MPHQITWFIIPTSTGDAEHTLHIRLDAHIVLRAISAPPHTLEISFPRGPTFLPFRTVWTGAPPSFEGFPENWGHDSYPDSGRKYCIHFRELVRGMPSWDRWSPIELVVTFMQQAAWKTGKRAVEFSFEDLRISPPVDGEICIDAPKPTGRWARLCEVVLYHLNFRPIHVIEGERLPRHHAEGSPALAGNNCRMRFHLASSREIDIKKLTVLYSQGTIYRWLTSKKALLVILTSVVVAAYPFYRFYKYVKALFWT